MSAETINISPAVDCVRTRHGFDMDEETAKGAGAYLLMSALESADPEVTIPEDVEELAADFIHSSYGHRSILPSARGSVGFCGRAIGRGACGKWQVNLETSQIEPKPIEDEPRGYTPLSDLEPDDVFEQSSFYDD